MKRRRKRKLKIILLITFSFLFLLFSTSYSLLSQELEISSTATISYREQTGGDFVGGIVDEDDGLVENEDGSSNFVGDENASVSNYIELPGDSYLWRILSIDTSGNLKIIRNRDESLISVFSTSNNADDWANTTVYQNLQNFYQQYLTSYSDVIVQNPEWLLTEASNSSPTTVTVTGTYTDSPIGLIRNDEVLNSSSSGAANNGSVSSWLNDGYQWTMTIVSNRSGRQAWRMNGGRFRNSGVNTQTVYRPVVYLKSTVTFSGGTGTEEEPFVVQ